MVQIMTDVNNKHQRTGFANIRQVSSDVYDSNYILGIDGEHRREIILAILIAMVATLAGVPVPLLLSLLVVGC